METVGAIIGLVLFVSVASITALVILSSLRTSKREFEEATRAAAEKGLSPYAQTDPWHAAYILVTTRQIDLWAGGQHWALDRSSVTEIARTLGGSLRINHTDVSQPPAPLALTQPLAVFFSPDHAAELVAALAARGYPVTPETLVGFPGRAS